MSFFSTFATALLALMLAPFSTAVGADIVWSAEYDSALGLAASENKVVFVAVNMDGEKANDRLAEDVYHSKTIAKLTESTVNLIASNYSHSGAKCARFGSLTCQEHKRVDIAVRENLLEPDKQGFVVAPQHVFLTPAGEVILSVPYEVTEPELEWCFFTALRRVDPTFEWKLSSEARAPRRLIMDGVFKPGSGLAGVVRPVTREEALELIKEVKRGMPWEEAIKNLRRIMTSEEKEAMEFIKTQLRSNSGGGGGGRGGRGGGANGGADRRKQLLRGIGAYGAAKYWEIVEEYAGTSEYNIRLEAIVALEQLAAPESARMVEKLLKKEKTTSLMKDWYRALGAVSSEAGKAKRRLLKAVKSEKDRINRINAIFALGYLIESEDVTEVLFEFVDGEDVELRAVAALALALTRNTAHTERLEARLKVLSPEEETKAKEEDERRAVDDKAPIDVLSLRAAIAVLKGGALGNLRKPARQVTQAPEPRPRLFGFSARTDG